MSSLVDLEVAWTSVLLGAARPVTFVQCRQAIVGFHVPLKQAPEPKDTSATAGWTLVLLVQGLCGNLSLNWFSAKFLARVAECDSDL